MVKPASRRSKKFKEGVDPNRIKKILENVKPGMVEKQSEYFAQIVLVEEKAKKILEEAGVSSYQIAQYLILARQCYSVASKFRGGTRDLEAQNLVNHWNQRGLDGTLLTRVCEISGCNVTSPGPGFVPAHTHVRADITDFAHIHEFNLTTYFVTGGRLLDTVYQNTYGVPIFVNIGMYFVRVSGVNAVCHSIMRVGPVDPPVIQVGLHGLMVETNNPEKARLTPCFFVPTDWYYKAQTVKDALGSSITRFTWAETTLTIGVSV